VARHGFTLPEILVSAAVVTLLLGSAMMVFDLSVRSRRVTVSAQALSTALIIEETIAGDLKRLVQVGPSPVRFWPDRPSRIAWFAVDPGAGAGAELGVRGVRYSLDKAGALLMREWAGSVRSVGSSPLTTIEFHPFAGPTGPMVRVNLEVGRTREEPEGEPLTTSFLAPIAAARRRESLTLKLLGDFKDPLDRPGDQSLPDPAPPPAPSAPPVPIGDAGGAAGAPGPDASGVLPEATVPPPPRPRPSPGP
jgi:prepilin-type N-terminal cleavage/methylation domain-containing protein